MQSKTFSLVFLWRNVYHCNVLTDCFAVWHTFSPFFLLSGSSCVCNTCLSFTDTFRFTGYIRANTQCIEKSMAIHRILLSFSSITLILYTHSTCSALGYSSLHKYYIHPLPSVVVLACRLPAALRHIFHITHTYNFVIPNRSALLCVYHSLQSFYYPPHPLTLAGKSNRASFLCLWWRALYFSVGKCAILLSFFWYDKYTVLSFFKIMSHISLA